MHDLAGAVLEGLGTIGVGLETRWRDWLIWLGCLATVVIIVLLLS